MRVPTRGALAAALAERLGAGPRLPAPHASGEALVEAAGLGVTLGGTRILEGIDLTVRAGEILAILGPNGAGKSTLLGALAGDIRHSGDARIAGRPVGEWTPRELALRRSVLRQSNPLSFPFNVLDVVRMGRAPWRGLDEALANEQIVAEELARTDTLRFAERTFTSLSGGERARVALARALAQRAAVLMLDEPSAALDINYQEQVLALARWYARRGNAVIVVLHDLAAAAAYADRVLVLDRGRARALGTPAEVLDAGLLSEVYRHPIRVRAEPEGGIGIVPERFADELELGAVASSSPPSAPPPPPPHHPIHHTGDTP